MEEQSKNEKNNVKNDGKISLLFFRSMYINNKSFSSDVPMFYFLKVPSFLLENMDSDTLNETLLNIYTKIFIESDIKSYEENFKLNNLFNVD